MDATDIRERELHCATCSSGMSELEMIENRDKCAICSAHEPRWITIGLWRWLVMAYLEWRIVRTKRKLARLKEENAYYLWCGALGLCGVTNFTDLRHVSERKILLRELKKSVRL